MIETRVLYYVPVIHEKADFGPLKESYEHHLRISQGTIAASIFQCQIQQYWNLIGKEIEVMPFDYSNLQIYWDSCIIGYEKIILEFSIENAKTTEVLIIQKLLEKGAELVGTEDRKLVMAQLTKAQEILLEKNPIRKTRLWQQCRSENQRLVRERDEFIAKRINETLIKQGIIFLGAFHQIQNILEEDIKIYQIPDSAKIEISPSQDKVEIVFRSALQ